MRHEKQPLGGAVVVTVEHQSGSLNNERDGRNGGGSAADRDGRRADSAADRLAIEVLWTHTTDSMCLAYMSSQDNQAKVSIHVSILSVMSVIGLTDI